ncbi:MAG: rubrerythrin family protein [Bacillota bacterium]
MGKMTEENLRAAFAGESQAHMRYLIFAEKAEKEGHPNVARLFRAIAYAEQVHATNHLKALGELGGTAENLGKAVGGETYEVEEMYPAFLAVAQLQGVKEAERSMGWAAAAEKIHAALYLEARKKVEAGQCIGTAPIVVCPLCGHTAMGEPPDRCPICGARGDRYVRF